MVTTQDTAASDVANSKALRRSSWKADLIRRGQLKISGPLPVAEDTGEDTELAAKRHTLPPPPSNTDIPPRKNLSQEAIVSDPFQLIPDQSERAMSVPVQDLIPSRQLASPGHAANVPERSQKHLSADLIETFGARSPPSSPNRDYVYAAQKSKQRGGLRSKIRKIFGRKSKAENRQSQISFSAYALSDSRRVSAAVTTIDKDKVGSRGESEQQALGPVHEITPAKPLGSHLPFPMNVNAPEDKFSSSNRPSFEPSIQNHRRRATLPSVAISPTDDSSVSAGWDEATKRLADEAQDVPAEDENDIGLALSGPIESRRRSRSAGASYPSPQDPSQPLPWTTRRRSEEIRYWRDSYMSQSSLYSDQKTVKAEEEKANSEYADSDTLEHARHDNPLPPAAPAEVLDRSVSRGSNVRGVPSSRTRQDRSRSEANSQRPLSLEDRMSRLERNTRDLEQSVHHLAGRSHRQTIILENAPRGRTQYRQISPSESPRKSSRSTSRAMDTAPEEQHHDRPPTPPSPPQRPLLTPSANSFDAAGHVKPPFAPISPRRTAVSSSPERDVRMATYQTYHKSSVSTSDALQFANQLSAIGTILRHERKERKALEREVVSLQQQVSDMQQMMRQMARGSMHTYPTPSPDQSSSMRPGDHHHHHHRRRRWGDAEEDRRKTVVSRFSGSDSAEDDDDEIDDDNDEQQQHNNNNLHADNATTTEHDVGADGDVDDNDDMEDDDDDDDELGEISAPESVSSPELYTTPHEEAPRGYPFSEMMAAPRPVGPMPHFREAGGVEGGMF